MHTDFPPSPKYTMSEKWIMDMQKRKLLVEQNWIVKQQKTKQRISTCFDKLKVGAELCLSYLFLLSILSLLKFYYPCCH